ncbi:MAG TPA: ribonuclease R [Phycisphaerae bacterium]|nr:ribonuclease R [Phycisphaerae bacterium]
MPERYIEAILKYLAARDYRPLKVRQLARRMGVAEENYGTFRQAVKQLSDSGRVVMGAKSALMLPEITSRVVGFYRANPRGFGFVVPETPNAHADLFIPPKADGGAMTGDLVKAKVVSRGRRGGRSVVAGQVIEIIRRGQNRFVGTLQRAEGNWFVLPDGTKTVTPILIPDVSDAGPPAGTKVVAEIIQYGERGKLPTGVLVETLGPQGQIEVETLAVIRAHGLEDEFSAKAMADTRRAVDQFDPDAADGREDLTGRTIITIDPATARDYDDAVSLEELPKGAFRLGVHIADVSHFVAEGADLDAEARARGTSTYFPRRVVPMLPELLSNGVCSLQEGQRRYCKSVLLDYDADGNRMKSRFAETVIASAKRLTYEQAQAICDGKTGGFDKPVVGLVRDMEKLARRIEARRRKAGMIHLDLPDAELVLDEAGNVTDAVPEDQSYSHTIIEMLMVEANEAVAELLNGLNRPCLRRIHPSPDADDTKQLASFIRACGHKLPASMSHKDIQDLLDAVRGKPESYAVNLAVLRTFQQAEYSPMNVGHFALASSHYCHFTSPIRRYPDLTVHRLLTEHLRGRLETRPPEDLSELTKLGEHCTAAAHRAEAAEDELRQVLVLQLLAGKIGEDFDGVITGVANFGIFVQLRRFLIDGLVRLEDLGDDWWDVDAKRGEVRGEVGGRRFRIGDLMSVRVAAVDVARRQLNLVPARDLSKPARKKSAAGRRAKKKGRG